MSEATLGLINHAVGIVLVPKLLAWPTRTVLVSLQINQKANRKLRVLLVVLLKDVHDQM